MEQLVFTQTIHAGKEKVWKALWDDAHYRDWTSAFTPGSYAISNWNEGDKVQFLSPSGSGMFSVIEKKVAGSFMSFRHLGEIKDGVEQPSTPSTQAWEGSHENYLLEEHDGRTELKVVVETTPDFKDYMEDKFPVALQRLKDIAERS